MRFPDLDRLGVDLADHHREVRDMMARFAAERLAPGAAARERDHAFPSDLIGELAALGGMAMKVLETDGGPGLDRPAARWRWRRWRGPTPPSPWSWRRAIWPRRSWRPRRRRSSGTVSCGRWRAAISAMRPSP